MLNSPLTIYCKSIFFLFHLCQFYACALTSFVSAADDAAYLPPPQLPIKSVWECSWITIIPKTEREGEKWRCGWCENTFKPKHATRALYHLNKLPGKGIAVCKGAITNAYLSRYKQLLTKSEKRGDANKRTVQALAEYTEDRQKGAVELMSSKKARGSSISNQPSIDASIQNMSQADIRESNNSVLTTAIASFFHNNNIPVAAADSPEFRYMLQKARLAANDYTPPDRKRLGGELLDLLFDQCQKYNAAELALCSAVYGLVFLSDGATIKRMPFMNVIAPLSPYLHRIDCHDHLKTGGKKDAVFIAAYLERIVRKYDPTMENIDIFFFDGASNVQKGGEILNAIFPRMYSLHGGEHVISLFFSDLPSKAGSN